MIRTNSLILILFILPLALIFSSCKTPSQDQIPVSELPDPCDFVIAMPDLPVIKETWEQIRADSQEDTNSKTCRVGFRSGSVPATEDIIQAVVEGTLKVIFVENGLVLFGKPYTAELMEPPTIPGQAMEWEALSLENTYGDQTRLWRTEIGEEEYLKMPTYYLEFSKDHSLAYILVSTMGIKDQEALEILTNLAGMNTIRIPILVSE